LKKRSQITLQIGLLAILAIIYGPVLIELVRDWIRDPNYQHGFIIPIISGFLIYNHRKDLRDTPTSPAALGLLGIIAATALVVVGTAGVEVFTQRVGFVLLLASLVLFLFGWRHLGIVAFPLSLLFLAIPLPYVIYYGLTSPMQALAAKVAVVGLKLFGVQSFLQGNMIHLADTSLEVAEACSGIRSLYAFLAVGALVAYFSPVRLWARVLIFASAIPLSIAGNAVRVWGSGLGACVIGPEATHGTIHEVFGIIVFSVSLGIFFLIKTVVGKLWSSDT
jgi:exosortase